MVRIIAWVFIVLLVATDSIAQEKSLSDIRREECAQMRQTPLGKARTEEIVRNCRFFVECGLDTSDYYNCARGAVIGLILYDLQNGGGGSDDDQDLGGDDDNGSAAIMTGKGVVNYGDITYGDLYDKIVAYTQSPKYQAQKKSQKQLTVIQNETVTTENWNDAQKYLTEMGFSTQQLSELKALWTRYKHQAWTYGELLQQYNSGNRGIE